jgi:hypothetical protein
MFAGRRRLPRSGLDTVTLGGPRDEVPRLGMPLRDPEGTADGHDAAELSQPDEGEELPKQAAHAYSLSS